MKRFIAIFVVILALLLVSGCQQKESESVGTEPIGTEPVETNPPIEDTNNQETNNGSNDIDSKPIINLNNYISVSFSGYNLAGHASVRFDEEKFLLDNINDISYNEDNLQVYRELYGDNGKSAANNIIRNISVKLNKSSYLSNGDIVEIVWEINTQKLETYFNWKYICPPQSFTITGLKEAPTFDPFEDVNLTFSGIAPYAKAIVFSNNNRTGSYTISPNKNLKNGDKVKVTYYCADKSTMVANYGVYPSSYEKTYVVNGLDTYVQSIKELTNEQLDKLVSDAREKIWFVGYGNYKDAKYCGNYFYYTKAEPINEKGNTICFIFEHPQQIGAANSPNVYTVISLSNLLMDEKGELVYDKHYMVQGSNIYKSKEALNKTFVDECDDTMYCSSNVDFD